MSEQWPPRPGYQPNHTSSYDAPPFQRPVNPPSGDRIPPYNAYHPVQSTPIDQVETQIPPGLQTEETRPPQAKEIQQAEEVPEDPSFSYQGMQVVRGEYFAHINEPAITFVDSTIYVNSACIKKAPRVDYVQVLINPTSKKLVIRPSSEDIKDSFSWITRTGKPKHIICRMFYAMLVDLLNWNPEWRYKIIGKMIRNRNNEYLFVFDLTRTEIYKPTVVIDENGVEHRKVPRKPIYPDEWKNQFGPTVDEHTKALQINIFDGYAVFGIKDPKNSQTIE